MSEYVDLVRVCVLSLCHEIEMISQRVFGFRNFENYRLRVLAHCDWNGVINRI